MTAQTDSGVELLGRASLTAAELSELASETAGRPVRSRFVKARPIPYDWGSPATAGLWRVDLREAAGQEPPACSYFVKLIRHIRFWPGLCHIPEAMRAEFAGFFPWRAELDIHHSGISAILPEGMRTPALWHVKHAGDDHIALWWEFITERPGPWRPADYQRAAYLLGRLAARRREGAPANDSLPAACHDRKGGSSLRVYTESRVLTGVLPALKDGSIWRHPVLADALTEAADPDLPDAMLALGARLPGILDLLDRLPQTHAHGDASPQNLLLPASEPGTVVVIDWGFGTLLPIGFDLGQLLSGLAQAGQTDPAELAGIDAVIFPAYLEGLAAEDYQADPAEVRTGYVGGLAARSALVTLPLELLASPGGLTEQAQLLPPLRLARTLVDMAAEL